MIISPINTERFTLKSLVSADANGKYLDWFSNDRIKRYIQFKPLSIDDLKKYLKEKNISDDALMLGIFINNHVHIGNIKFEPIDFINKSAVMGILIGDPDWCNKGVGPEAIIAGANYLKNNYGVNEIQLGVDPQNIAAIKSYQKIGFKFSSEKIKGMMFWKM